MKQRRDFIKASGFLGLGLLMPNINRACAVPMTVQDNIHLFGKREGYTANMSILVSMMDWMRATVLRDARDLTQKELDFLLDDKSNTIGAMLLHLAATERFYQMDTFTGVGREAFDYGISGEVWSAASNLGDAGRTTFKNYTLSFYLDTLERVRDFSKQELGKRGDDWLMESTRFFGGQPTNNYCKWFHVVEHESNHNGQIRLIKSRVS